MNTGQACSCRPAATTQWRRSCTASRRPTKSMEIEAKFRVVDRKVFAELLQLTRLGTFDLVPNPAVEQQNNTYFDTPDRRLAARHYSLRVRDLGSRRIATVKRSLGTYAGVH